VKLRRLFRPTVEIGASDHWQNRREPTRWESIFHHPLLKDKTVSYQMIAKKAAMSIEHSFA
jgi:hypothetical protein